jgi:multiple sugar transport system substrate-binding protein
MLMASAACGNAESEAADPNGDLSGTLNFPGFFWQDPGHDWLLEQTDRFGTEHPGVTFSDAYVPFPNYHQKMYTDMAAGQAPDIVVPYDPQIRQWARQGLLEPLDEYLEAEGVDVEELIKPQQLAVVDGHIYGLLWYTNPRVLVYNQKMLSDAGLEPPANVDELNAAIERLRDESNQQFGFATVTGSDSPDATYLDIMPIIAGFGGAFVREGKPTANSPETVAALSFIEDNLTGNLVPRSTTQASYREAFINGKVGMITIGPFIVNAAKAENPPVGEQLSSTRVPLPSESNIAVNVFLAVPKDAQNKSAAVRFLLDSLLPEVQVQAAEKINGIPATGEVPEDFLEQNPWFQAPLDAAQVAVSYAPDGAEDQMPQILNIVIDNYQAMLATDATAQEAADAMQQELEELLGT